MLRRLPYEMANYICFIIISVLVVSLQTSLWMQIFGPIPAPYMWIPILCYWSITRGWVRGALMAYFLGLVLQTFTSLSLEMIFYTLLSLYAIMYLLRDRILWRGNVYFSLACFIATILHPVLLLVFSYFVEEHPIREFHFFHWILSPLLTALIAFPFYSLLGWLDRLSFGEIAETSEAEFS